MLTKIKNISLGLFYLIGAMDVFWFMGILSDIEFDMPGAETAWGILFVFIAVCVIALSVCMLFRVLETVIKGNLKKSLFTGICSIISFLILSVFSCFVLNSFIFRYCFNNLSLLFSIVFCVLLFSVLTICVVRKKERLKSLSKTAWFIANIVTLTGAIAAIVIYAYFGFSNARAEPSVFILPMFLFMPCFAFALKPNNADYKWFKTVLLVMAAAAVPVSGFLLYKLDYPSLSGYIDSDGVFFSVPISVLFLLPFVLFVLSKFLFSKKSQEIV